MPVPASATTVGAGRSTSSSSPRPGPVRQRKTASSSGSKSGGGSGSSKLWKFYSEDSPGIKVGPVPIMVVSLTFIASVFMLHIWGKLTSE